MIYIFIADPYMDIGLTQGKVYLAIFVTAAVRSFSVKLAS